MFYSRSERDQLFEEHKEAFEAMRSNDFSIIPNSIIRSKQLSDGEKMFYIHLTSLSDKQTGSLRHSNDTLAEELECSVSNVKKFLDALKKKKAIQTLSTGRHQLRIICLTPWKIL